MRKRTFPAEEQMVGVRRNIAGLIMKLILVTLLGILAETVTGEYQAVYPTQPIEAEEGDNVTLQCRLDPPINLSAYTVDVKRADNNDVVHAYRHKLDLLHDQMDRYRDRTTLVREDVSRGILTLLVSSVNQSDSGRYKFYVPKLMTSCIIDLIVVEKHQQNETKRNVANTTGPPVEEETEPDDRGVENRKSGRAGIIPAIFIILCVLIVVLVLRMRRTIYDYMKRCRGRTEQKPATAENGWEMKKLDTLDTQTADRDEDLKSPAGNGF